MAQAVLEVPVVAADFRAVRALMALWGREITAAMGPQPPTMEAVVVVAQAR